MTNSDKERFWSHVCKTETSGCWLWLRGIDKDGYGKFKSQGKTLRAHIVAYTLTYGPPIALVQHTCDTPCCVNPAHLKDGTQGENIRDVEARGRRIHCRLNAAAKLTGPRVNLLRLLWASGMFTQRDIAEVFGISQGQVSNVVEGRSWVS